MVFVPNPEVERSFYQHRYYNRVGRSVYNKRYAENKEEIKIRQKSYYLKNKLAINKRNLINYHKNKQKKIMKNLKLYGLNKETKVKPINIIPIELSNKLGSIIHKPIMINF